MLSALFCAFNISEMFTNFVHNPTVLVYSIKFKPEQNINSTKKANHILAILRQGEFCGYYLKNHTNAKIKEYFQIVLLLACLVEHPVLIGLNSIIYLF